MSGFRDLISDFAVEAMHKLEDPRQRATAIEAFATHMEPGEHNKLMDLTTAIDDEKERA